MQSAYYIVQGDLKDGPHDLVAIMRRIRIGKIQKNTYIYIDAATSPTPAIDIPEIALFFDRTEIESQRPLHVISSWTLIQDGWHFITHHSILTVYAGAMLLLCIMLSIGLVGQLGIIAGGICVWCIFVLLQNFYFIFTLRLFRGQSLGAEFFNGMLAPSLLALMHASLLLAVMMAGGYFLLLIPGLIVAVIYIFVPFLLLDKRYRVIEAMQASRLLLQKYGRRYIPVICLLVLLYLFSVVLIFPIVLALPIFSAAIAQLYEELTAK